MNMLDLLDRPIAYHRCFVWLGAGITGAVFLSQALYWTRRTNDQNGWFYKSQAEWEEETGLTRHEQDGARKKLCALGVLEEIRRGVPARLFYRLNMNRLREILVKGKPLKPVRNQDCRNSANWNAENQQARLPQTDEQDCHELANITENTTEITTETTIDIFNAAEKSASDDQDDAVSDVLPKQKRKKQDSNMDNQKTNLVWLSYSSAYMQRYGTQPVRNAKINSQISQLVKRLGEEASLVAEFYVYNVNERFVAQKLHPFGLLLSSAESYRTQWATGRTMTQTRAQQIDSSQANASAADEAIAMLRAREQGAYHP